MRWLIRIFYLLLFIVLMLASISFLNANTEVHQLKFLEWQLPQMTVGKSVLLALGAGVFIGFIAGFPLILGLRIRIRRLRKQLSATPASEVAVSS